MTTPYPVASLGAIVQGYRHIDIGNHTAFARAVWTMQQDLDKGKTTPRCEDMTTRMVASWNACRSVELDHLVDGPGIVENLRQDREQLQEKVQQLEEFSAVQAALLGSNAERMARMAEKIARQKLAIDRMRALLLYLVSQDGPQPGSATWAQLAMAELRESALADINEVLGERAAADDTEGGAI